ncbi:MAG: lipopolysaccharide biosynthesis protein [Nitrosomonas sp.]|nr:lipopolysaccharide biosynthesis protein [Nitrosomonas sp.]
MNRLFWYYKIVIIELKYYYNTILFSFLKEELHREPIVRYSHSGSVKANYDQPLCFFCSYDKHSTIKENVYYYLNELRLAGFDIIFISSSDTISKRDLEKLSSQCIKIINRENKGYDFYGWKIGLRDYPHYRMHRALLLANDSVLGPFFSIKDIINKLENEEADIIGMTDSLQFHPHLQSYFLYCKKTVSNSQEFIGFFNSIDVLEFKMAIVRKYEVGFSQSLCNRFKLSALYSLDNSLSRIQSLEKPKNLIDITHDLWKPLITELKFPFLKKRIVAKRGITIGEIAEVLTESNSNYPLDILADRIR